MQILNYEMVKHPLNWVIILLMVLIAGIAVNFILKYQTSD